MSKKRDLLSAGARAAFTLALGAAAAVTATPAFAQDEDDTIVVTRRGAIKRCRKCRSR
ncbi:MAG: hypothetical protein R3C27_15675 [Hyphomonadaceae bacterium]